MTISMDKQYRTEDGKKVRIYATDGSGRSSVHGSVLIDGKWEQHCWDENGVCLYNSDFNLLEIKPRIQREFWANLDKDGSYLFFETKQEADLCRDSDISACVKITIDCEEGEGL